jgi:ribonuclease T2
MLHQRIRRAAMAAIITINFVFLFAVVALAQDGVQATADKRQNAPDQFDFYVLALSWSPSYCAEAHERNAARKPDPQCGGRPFAFVVHGLWPQYEKGFPSYCQVPAPRLDRTVIGRALDLMPSPALVMHEWDRHGTCSGLSAGAYFETVRKARAVVKIPAAYLDLAQPVSVTPDDIADAFVKANPGLDRADMAVACNKTRLSEVRLCLGKDFSFHACPDVVRHTCTREKVEMPAMRSEHAANE